MKQTIIDCECGCHMLKVEHEDDTFYLAMFNFGSGSTGLWHRIKLAWKILTTGELYGDQIVMNPEEANKLSTFISENNGKN